MTDPSTEFLKPKSSLHVRQIQNLDIHELETAAQLLARAFRDNPLNCAATRSTRPARRLRCNLAGMRALLSVATERSQIWFAHAGAEQTSSGDPATVLGAAVSVPPGAYPLPPPSFSLLLRTLAEQGPRVSLRWGRIFETLSSLRPPEPHAYLALLGVAPEAQNGGVGSVLLRAWQTSPEARGVLHYLETDRWENVRFYRRAGFGIRRELEILGAHIWCLARAADL